MSLRLPPGGGFLERGLEMGRSGLTAYRSQMPNRNTKTEAPDPTIGGGISSGIGMGLAGYAAGEAGMLGASMGGPAGAAIGFGLGMIGHLLS